MAGKDDLDDFEDDDIEPVWASPDDAEDDWDEGFDEGGDFSDDEFEASDGASDAGFDQDEYDEEFAEDDAPPAAAAAADDFDDDFESYEDDGYSDDGDYEDEDDFDGEDGEGGEGAAAAAGGRSPMQKYLPYAMMGGFGLFVAFIGYSFLFGGSTPAPQPVQQLPNPVQTAQNNPTPAPAAVPSGNPDPLTGFGQSDPLGVPGGQQDLASLSGTVQNVLPDSPMPMSGAGDLGMPQGLGGGLEGLPQPTPIPGPSGGIGSLGQPSDSGGMGGQPVLGQLGNQDPLGGLGHPGGQAPGLSGSLGLSTEPAGLGMQNGSGLPQPTPLPEPQAIANNQTAQPSPTGGLPQGVNLPSPLTPAAIPQPGVSKEDLNQLTATLQSDLRNEIKAGIASIKDDLNDNLQEMITDQLAMVRADINGLERRIDEITQQQQQLASMAEDIKSAPKSAPAPAKNPVPAKTVEQAAPAKPEPQVMADASEKVDVGQAIQDQLEAAITGSAPTPTKPAAAPAPAKSSVPVIADKQQSSTDDSRPPTIRRSAAPKDAPPVPSQKPGAFVAEARMPQPGAFGAPYPVQMAQSTGIPNAAYQLRGVSSGTAWISAQESGTIVTVNRGDYLPGLGRVTEIRRSFIGGEVVTDRGIIRQ